MHPGSCLHTSPTLPCVFLPPHPHSLLDAWPLLIIFPAGLTCSSMSPAQATGVPSPHILVAVLPGLPTAAELFVLPYQDPTGENKRSAEDLEQVSQLSLEACTTLLLVSNHPHSSPQGSGLENQSTNCLWSLTLSGLPFIFLNPLIPATASHTHTQNKTNNNNKTTTNNNKNKTMHKCLLYALA